jgi:hypothetical protein
MWPDLASCCLDSAKEEILPAAQLDGLQGQDKSAIVICGLKVLIKVCIDMTRLQTVHCDGVTICFLQGCDYIYGSY